jgi:hypothetical protein
MNSSAFSWVAVAATIGGLVGCFLDWAVVGDASLFKVLESVTNEGGFSVRLQKWSLGLLMVMGGYLAFSFRSSPMRKYAQLMVLFGIAMGMILVSARAWLWADAGLKPGIGFILCSAAAAIYLLSSLLCFISIKRSVQPWK